MVSISGPCSMSFGTLTVILPLILFFSSLTVDESMDTGQFDDADDVEPDH